MKSNVNCCQRCGKDHSQLEFLPLNNAIDEWNWWTICPETKQPILLCVTETENSEQVTPEMTQDYNDFGH